MPRSLTQTWCRCFSKETHGRLPTGPTSQVDRSGSPLFMRLAELERWSLERDWGQRRKQELAQHLTRYVVLPVNRELCGKWAEVSFAAKRKGRPIQTADAWIAASALYYEVPLITNNRGDYSAVDGLVLLSA